MNSVLTSFLSACIPDEFCCKQWDEWLEKVLSSIDVEGGVMVLDVWGALRGDGNRQRRF